MLTAGLIFLFYRTPTLMTYILVENAQWSIPFFTFIFLALQFSISTLDRKTDINEKLVTKLKEKLKDAKLQLLSHMDPNLREAVKEIVKKDMKQEIEQMRNSDEGCSQKCRLLMQKHTLDVERNAKIVEEMINFRWCDQCKQGQPGAVHICQSGCGQKLFSKCLPLMKEYGQTGEYIVRLESQIEQIT